MSHLAECIAVDPPRIGNPCICKELQRYGDIRYAEALTAAIWAIDEAVRKRGFAIDPDDRAYRNGMMKAADAVAELEPPSPLT